MIKHDTILIASALQENRTYLREVFGKNHNLLEAVSVSQILLLLKQNAHCISAVVIDPSDESLADDESYRVPETLELLRSVPIIIISENDNPDVLNRAFGFGAADVIPMGYDPYAMLRRVDTIIELHLHKQNLEKMVSEQAEVLRRRNDMLVGALSSIIEYRSVETGQHILRIRHFTQILLEQVMRSCPEYGLNEHNVAIIASASALHDIGKIAIPDSILIKPGQLTEDERKIMQTHSETGCRILDTVGGMADEEYLRYAYNICRYHHERWDGMGYPEGIAGENIPICAQVVGLADAYDVLTSKRVYREAFSFATAFNMIVHGECGMFSPKLIECFKNVAYRFEELANEFADGKVPSSEDFDFQFNAPVNEDEQDSMEYLQGKYYALANYINVFLIELDLDKRIFHLMYNPYPEFAQLQQMDSLDEIRRMILERYVHPEDHGKMEEFLDKKIRKFLNEGHRRAGYRFRMCSKEQPEGYEMDLTLMRINPLDSKRKTLAVLARKVTEAAGESENREACFTAEHIFCRRNDESNTVVTIGENFKQLTGYSFAELEERFGGRFVEIIHPDDRVRVHNQLTEQLRESNILKLEYRIIHKDGTLRYIVDRGQLVLEADGGEYLYTQLIDVTETQLEVGRLQERIDRYESILEDTENVLFEWNLEQDTIVFSEAWEKIFGLKPVQTGFMELLKAYSHVHPDDVPLLFDKMSNLENGSKLEVAELRVSNDNGRYLWCRIRATAVRNDAGKLLKLSGLLINIDQEKQAEQILQYRAEHDALTKLLNKEAARKQAESYFTRYSGEANSAMMIIDLDNFKQVNDRYGHLFGDTALTQASREIRKLFRDQDIVARIGGDEFMVLMRGVSDRILLENRCKVLIQKIQNCFPQMDNKQNAFQLSCSIGIAQSPIHGKTYVELFQCADQALYLAKERGKNGFAFYEETSLLVGKSGRFSAVNEVIDSDIEPSMANDNIVRYVFQKLYTSNDVAGAINEILGYIGRKMNVSRVYIFENSDDNAYCNNTYEWCNEGITSEIDNLQQLSYDKMLHNYADNFDEEGIFYCTDITVLPAQIRQLLEEQGIQSMLQCAFREKGVFRGYIGFDECVEQRMWTKEQIELLSFFSETLYLFLTKMRKQDQVQRQADELETIFENQNAWFNIIDPDTYEVKFFNEKMREAVPGLRAGQICYKALLGRDSPCLRCPAADIRRLGTTRHLERGRKGELLLVEGTLIRWNGKDACLISSRELPELVPND